MTRKSAPDAETGIHGKQLAFVFIGLMLAMFVSSISETIAATALPTIVGDLGGVEIMQWVDTTFILTSTITMPIYGKLGDLIGRKYLLMSALVLYTIGKVICGFAPSMEMLITGRAVSGLGGGGLIILSQAVIADVTPPRTRGKYLGAMGAVFGVSSVLGPLLGGWFVQVTGWRMLFFFTVPIALVALVALALFLKQPSLRGEHPPIDVAGSVLMALSVASLVLAIAWGGNQYAWVSWQIIGLFALFAVCATAFVFVERRAKEPIIPMVLFKNKNFVLCTVTGMLLYIGFMGMVGYLPTYFQIVDRLSPETAGFMTIPMMAGMLITSLATGFIAARTGKYKWMPIAMCAVVGVGFFLMSTLQVDTAITLTLIYEFVAGFGMGLGLQILVLVVQNEFPHAIVGTVTAANNFFRQIGSTLGTSLVGSLFTARLTHDLANTLPPSDNISIASITPSYVDQLPHSLQTMIASGYSDALVPLFACFIPLAVIGLVLMCFLKETPLAKKIDHSRSNAQDSL